MSRRQKRIKYWLLTAFLVSIGGMGLIYLGINYYQDLPKTDTGDIRQGTEVSTSSEPKSVSELLENPTKFDGKHIKIRAVYYETTEKVVLVEKVVPSSDSSYRYVPKDQIWVSWGINPPTDFYDRLSSLQGIGGNDYYGCIEATGVFKQAPSGHMGDYPYRFTIEEITVCEDEQ